MPTDTRRLPVPDESKSPYSVMVQNAKMKTLLKEDGSRHDGRSLEQVRPIFVKTGIVSQAKGSAYIEMNHTKLICAVYGPREVTRREDFSMTGQLNCELKFATFSCRYRRQHQQDVQERAMTETLLQAIQPAVRLETFPKARMDVFVTVLQDDGSALAGAMTCASLAMADAGIEMYDLIVACALRQNKKIFLLDPCLDEEYNSQDIDSGSLTLALMPSLHQVSAITQNGKMDSNTLSQGMASCIINCQKLYPILQQCLTKSLQNYDKQQESILS